MRRLTLRDLEHVVALAEAGSVTGAAAAVGLSQPAMSASLATIERALGVSLFVRHRGRGVTLTSEGALLLAEARSVIDRADEMESRLRDAVEGSGGHLVVGSLVTVAPIVVPGLVRSFLAAHGDVEVEMRTGAQDELLGWVRSGEVHLALTYDMELGADVVFELLADARPHALLAADHPAASADSVALVDLAGEPYVLLDLPLSREYFMSLFLASGVECRPVARPTELNLVRSLVGNGFGYSLVNLLPAGRDAEDGSHLAYVPLRSTVPPIRLGIVRRRDAAAPRVVERFEAFAAERFAAAPRWTGE